nr:isoform 2 of serine/threonine protein phosphatase 2a 55 kda regulatory subunit b alpha isoform [Quercus suber]
MNGGDEVVAAPVDPPQPLEWKFSQVFGERTAAEEVQEVERKKKKCKVTCINCCIKWSVKIHLLKVQEKKIKKISDMNLDSSKAVGNCSVASSSNSLSPRPYLANGGCPDRSYSSLSNELSFPPGGIPSLRLPMVVVCDPVY